MTSDSAGQTPSKRARQAPEHEHGAAQPGGGPERPEPERREDFGPLELLRTRKADGRALLLFSHRREDCEQ